MRPTPWIERRMPLGQQTDQLPLLLERLHGTPERLRELMQDLPTDSLRTRAVAAWSMFDHAAHLLLVQQRFHVRVEEYRALCHRLSPLGFDDAYEWLRGQVVREPGDMIEEFRLERSAFIAEVRSLPEGILSHQAEHPCRGPGMRIADALYWLAEHDDHHLACIRAIRVSAVGA